MNGEYILDGQKNPVLEKDLIVWGKWLEEADRKVARTEVKKDVEVSTIFLGLDHQFGEGPPILFETMVFGGKMDGEMDRYSTWEEAERGHEAMVERVLKEG